MTSNGKQSFVRDLTVIGSNTTGEVFATRKSSAGSFRVMDAVSFSKASRRASQALERDERKNDKWRR